VNFDMPTKNIVAITFDLWETLIADSPALDEKRTRFRVKETGRLLARTGILVKKNDLLRAHRQVWERCLKQWDRAVDLPFEEQVELFLDLAQPGLSKKAAGPAKSGISAAYAEAALKYPPKAIKGARETLSSLKSAGYRLGLICNTGRTPGFVLRKLLRKYRLLGFFDVALFSDEILIRKPDPRIFRMALKGLKVAPRQAVHVGDDPGTDIAGALKAGMEALWVERDKFDRPRSVHSIKNVGGLEKELFQMKRPLP
jgi:putative hydrolase of the HAD superfamily